jgi:hypothetical protein
MINFERALEIANRIGDKEKREHTLMLIARQMARDKLFEYAIRIAESLESKTIRYEAFCYIGCELIKSGFGEDGRILLEKVRFNEIEWEELYYDIVDILKEYEVNDLLIRALEIVLEKLEIEDFESKPFVLLSIAEDFRNIGFVERSLRIIDDVLDLAGQTEDLKERIDLLFYVASAYISLGLKDRGMELIREISELVEQLDDEEREDTLDTITLRLADFEEVGDRELLQLAVDFALRIEDNSMRNERLRNIAERLAELNYVDDALRVCEMIDDEDKHSEALSSIALHLVGNFNPWIFES